MSSSSVRTVRDLLHALGVPEDDIARAEADGTQGLLAVERMITADQNAKYTQAEVIEITGLGNHAVRFWRALGFPDPRPDDRIFSDFDVEMLTLVDQLVKLRLIDYEEALQMTRVIGSSMARIASAQIDALESRVDEPALHDGTEAGVLRARFVLPAMPKVFEYTWKRHLQVAARRRMVRETGAERGYAQCVGFADLVGFTALSQQLSDHDLAAIVDRFESTAYDIVSEHGGRVIKMIGDEVMFAVDDVAVAVEIGLSLAGAYHDDESLSDVRVGLACGPVLEREGDLYGPTVNLASRVVSIAYAGSVVASSEIHDALESNDALRWKSLRTRQLKNIGRVQLYAVRRASDDFEKEGGRERARRRRGAIRDKVAELIERKPSEDRDGADEDGAVG